MKKKELKNNEQTLGTTQNIINKTTSKNCSNLISKHQLLISDHKGITLIALVITIIVMLILVGVTVTVALNGGLFNQAKVAVSDTRNAVDKENELSTGKVQIGDKWYNSIEEYTNGEGGGQTGGGTTSNGKWTLAPDGSTATSGEATVNIGDYVDYSPTPTTYPVKKLGEGYTGYANTEDLTTDVTLKWRILGVDENGCLTIISKSPTSQSVYFSGAKGYNNGVYILNDICKTLYSRTDWGVNARSLTIEDVEAGFSPDAINERDSYTNPDSKTQYNHPKTYTSNLTYPALYAQENGSGIGVDDANKDEDRKKDGIGVSKPYYSEAQLTEKIESYTAGKDDNQGNVALTCTHTYYKFLQTSSSYCMNENFEIMIFHTFPSYWLASRWVSCNVDRAGFGLNIISVSNFNPSRFV